MCCGGWYVGLFMFGLYWGVVTVATIFLWVLCLVLKIPLWRAGYICCIVLDLLMIIFRKSWDNYPLTIIGFTVLFSYPVLLISGTIAAAWEGKNARTKLILDFWIGAGITAIAFVALAISFATIESVYDPLMRFYHIPSPFRLISCEFRTAQFWFDMTSLFFFPSVITAVKESYAACRAVFDLRLWLQ
jgi:hypothetical protein